VVAPTEASNAWRLPCIRHVETLPASDQPDEYEPITIQVNFKKQGYATTSRHGQSVDARLHRPIPRIAEIKEGESFLVYVERNKKAILLIRTSELNNKENVQKVFGGMGGSRLLTPEFIDRVLDGVGRARMAALFSATGGRKPRTKRLSSRHR